MYTSPTLESKLFPDEPPAYSMNPTSPTTNKATSPVTVEANPYAVFDETNTVAPSTIITSTSCTYPELQLEQWGNDIVATSNLQGTYFIDPALLSYNSATAARDQYDWSDNSRQPTDTPSGAWTPHEHINNNSSSAFFLASGKNSRLFNIVVGGASELVDTVQKNRTAFVDVRAACIKEMVFKVLDIAKGRRLNLDLRGGLGSLEVYIPRSFRGLLHIRTRRTRWRPSGISLLSGISARKRVIFATKDEVLAIIDDASESDSFGLSVHPGGNRHDLGQLLPTVGEAGVAGFDFARIVTRGRNVVVGYLDDESAPVQHSPWMRKRRCGRAC